MASLEIIPFSPGRRPTDEGRAAWMGSSDQVAFVNAGPDNRCYLLLKLAPEGELTVTIDGRTRPFAPQTFSPDLRDTPLGQDRPYVLALDPDTDFAGDYSFAQRFSRRVDVRVRQGAAEAATTLDVYDLSTFGCLYERIVDRLVKPDTERQAPGLHHAHHPWFPVLLIGSYKAELYTRALVGDVVHKRQNLADPGWLVKVGLYLELLTGLGVVEAVKDDIGDLLTPEERAAFETWDDLRARLNVECWQRVWALRRIGLPIGPLNLLDKRRATLEFLHVHHEDLKCAIEFAGPNHTNAQETWHRVFRDAERAVLRKTPDAFPELHNLPAEVRRWLLWHRRGHLLLKRALRVPGPLPRLLGDQDGLFASACNQYRASMNHVADWAQTRGLMDHAGEEAVPRQVSLLEAHMNQPTRVALLQARDGYDPSKPLQVGVDLPPGYTPPLADLAKLLAGTPLFALLREEELDMLAHTARPLTFGPLERIIVQGQEGDSLFVVVEGTVEVMLRRTDGAEVNLGTRPQGTILGEMSLLTGEPRSATVRAVDGALVYEVGRRQYEPILAKRPELVDALERAMEMRLRSQGEYLERYDAERARAGFTRRIRRLLAST